MDEGIHREAYHFRLDSSLMETIFSGSSPTNDGTELVTLKEPKTSYPNPMAPERPEEFAPGLDPEMQKLADALSEFKEKTVKEMTKKAGPDPSNNKFFIIVLEAVLFLRWPFSLDILLVISYN